MKTTLKTGAGRARPFTGGPARLPAGVLAPAVRYRSPRRGRLYLFGKVALWAFVALFIVAGALAGGAWLFINQSVEAIRAHTPEAIEAQRFLDIPIPGEPTVAMVIGYDARAGKDSGVPGRSDTIMLIRADPQGKAVTLLSFPRDLVVDIAPCANGGGYRGKINEAFTVCGQKGTLKTVKQLTDIPVNYLVTVNFRGFRTIVDRLGGVYMDIDRRYFNDNSGRSVAARYATIDLHPGYQRLTGSRSLDYVRYRHTDSDFVRNARQQDFVRALKQQVSSFWSFKKVPGIITTISESVEVGSGGEREIDLGTLLSYAKLVYELPSGSFQQVRITGISGYSSLQLSEQDLDRAIYQFMNPDIGAAEKAAGIATGQRPKRQQAPEASSVTVEVLNGNGLVGAADEAAYQLAKRGYQVVVGGNADRFDHFETKILYSSKVEGAKQAAQALGLLFGDSEVVTAPREVSLETMVRVILGATFHGALAPSPVDATPKRQQATVVNDPDPPAALLRPVQRKLDFKLYLPRVRDWSSRLDWEEPLRVYRLNGHDAVRLTFVRGNSYWGVQQTSWTETPILEGPSLVRRIKGREYRLFFSGPKLHLIAFEEDGAVYWVVNTLLDDLANETMIAIAKGLRPMRAN